MTGNSNSKLSSNKFKMGLMAFSLVTLASLMSIRNFPTMALVKWQLITFTILAVILYLIPAILTSSELGTGWPQNGGVYVWVKEAFGQRWGFTAVWMQWFQMTIGFVSVLSFVAATFSYAIDPALANNKIYIFAVIAFVWWLFTFINFRGLKTYTRINSVFLVIGTLIPCALLIIGGFWFVGTGHHIPLFTMHPTVADFIPNLTSIDNLSLLVVFVFLFVGVEMTAAHAGDIKNVGRNYPLGLLIAGIVLVVVSILGALAVGFLVPTSGLNLLAGIMQGFEAMFGAGVLTSFIALLITIGSIGEASSWILGPVRGLLVTAKDGNLPKVLQKTNSKGMPTNMMIVQGIIVTFWAAMFVALPGGVNSSFWILLSLTTLVYIVMYLFMYAAVIKLRYSQPNVKRAFKIPGGKLGAWIVGVWGFAAMVFTFIVALFPPSQINGSGLTTPEYVAILLIGTIVVAIIPLIIYRFRRADWKPANNPELQMHEARNQLINDEDAKKADSTEQSGNKD
ncbi:MAG: amino acid permease [Methanobrevibacter sp.]|uniref:amino acid permease n=1 Tax=Methanobrevibacter sp. TaxID=66852 RepID=UPI0026DF947F|nr:amino acid permease [Methanobrevibacter sp.]MDO5849562.1 amino acid permease [Methanobrevibacter sp.]